MDQRLICVAMMLFTLPPIAALDWVKLNLRPVCFGARDNQYGSFNVRKSGKIAGVKLVHLSGYVTCDNRELSNWSFWGCSYLPTKNKQLNAIITTTSNTIVMPLNPFRNNNRGKWYELPGYNSLSPEIILPRFPPYSVSWGQELRLWYGEDLGESTESDNGGLVCCNVYALYV